MEIPIRTNRAEFQRPPQGEFRARAARKSDDTTEKVQPVGGGGLLMVVSRTERFGSCGYKLANDGRDTRSIQHYLGHRSIASTVRYTALVPDRFKDFWKD